MPNSLIDNLVINADPFSFLMFGLHNQCHSSVKYYAIMAQIFTDNYSEVEYFDESNKESGGSVVSGMQLGTENTDAVDANLVAGWQPLVDPEPEEEEEWCDTDVDPPLGQF
jgi:hypothetical protein